MEMSFLDLIYFSKSDKAETVWKLSPPYLVGRVCKMSDRGFWFCKLHIFIMQNIVKNLQGRYDGITRTSAVGCTIARGYSLIHRFCSATDSDEERNMSFLIVEMAGKMDYRIYNRCRMFPPASTSRGFCYKYCRACGNLRLRRPCKIRVSVIIQRP